MLDRIAAHGAQGIDFFPHFHGAEFGRVGAAGPAGDHDRYDQHADFAQDEDADHVDDVGIRSKFPEVENSLLGNDASDQKRDQHDDRNGLPANAIQVIYGGRRAQRARP